MKKSDKGIEFLAYLDDKIKVIRLSRNNPQYHFHKSWNHEEGWSSFSEGFRLETREDGDWVVNQVLEDGRDCDGRLSRYMELECNVKDLRNGYKGIYPKWEKVEEHQRDYSAEAMGY